MENQIVMKHYESLIPYAGNPRDNDASVEYVANSIQQFGFKVPMVIDKDGVIAAGHTRLKAVRRLIEQYGYDVPLVDGKGQPTGKTINLSVLPCVLADDLTEDQIKAFRIADNKTGELRHELVWLPHGGTEEGGQEVGRHRHGDDGAPGLRAPRLPGVRIRQSDGLAERGQRLRHPQGQRRVWDNEESGDWSSC